MTPKKKICVIGLGYIGLPTAVMFASKGCSVNGVDINSNVVNLINNGIPHIDEPGLTLELNKQINSGRLKAFNLPIKSDVYIIAVPTPFSGNFKADLSYIDKAVNSIASLIKLGDLIILESTSPVGTTLRIRDALIAYRPDLNICQENNTNAEVNINIAYCPERVLPGRIMEELSLNDRIVGGITNECSRKAKELYQIFVDSEIHTTDSKTAELAKLTENSFRDVNIAFANEVSMICDDLQINTGELIRLANKHPRVNILEPGVGVGGHCIAIDPWFIVESAPSRAKIIKLARQVNNEKTQWVYEKILRKRNCINKKQVKLGIMGLSFKPNVGDLRESPAMDIVLKLAKNQDVSIILSEPNINKLPLGLEGQNITLDNNLDAFKDVDLIITLVKHKEFFSMTKLYKNKNIIDFCG
jgi:UDP-N-acetyl-D-mannosaminuronic acid dehydrogenase